MDGFENINNEDLLNYVTQAIVSIAAGGQSYQIGSRRLDRADLGTLYKMKKELEEQQSRETSNLLSGCYVAEFDGR